MKVKKILSLVFVWILVFILGGCAIFPITPKPNPDDDKCKDGHTFVKGECSICGAKDPDYKPDDNDTPPDEYKCKDGHIFANGVCTVCGATDPNYVAPVQGVDGWYALTLKTISGGDVTNTYLYNMLHLADGVATWYETDVSGQKVTDATYTHENDVVTVKVGLKKYEFSHDKTAKTLSYSGKVNRKPVVMNFSLAENYSLPTDKGSVNFSEQLFGESLEENFYNYCPTIMLENAYTMHIWYCANEESGNVTDFVAYRKGILHSDGKWTFTEKQIVLRPGTGNEWDSRHACDPSVVKGEFNYNNVKYNYLMAYLGCKTSDSSYNEVGIAVAQNPQGPWVKVNELNPIANFYQSSYYDGSTWYWGYGQPSLVSVDKQGKVLLFYAMGTKITATRVELWDLSNLNDAKKLNSADLTNKNITNASSESDVINNGDFAYDPVGKRIYCLKEDFGYPTNGNVDWIAGSNTMFYVDMASTDTYAGQTLFGEMSWNRVGAVTQSITGFARNHNMGIVTDAYGWIMDSTRIPIVYTMSQLRTDYPDWELGGQWPALHTYRLHGLVIEP